VSEVRPPARPYAPHPRDDVIAEGKVVSIDLPYPPARFAPLELGDGPLGALRRSWRARAPSLQVGFFLPNLAPHLTPAPQKKNGLHEILQAECFLRSFDEHRSRLSAPWRRHRADRPASRSLD
jgi:hypothetical protein